MTMKKKINLEELKMEQLKKIVTNIDKISDTYQNTKLRIMFLQALNGMSSAPINLPEGRDAIDNTKTKKDNTEDTVKENDNNISEETIETVNNIKDAIANVMEDTSENNETEEVTETEVIEETQPETTEELAQELPGTIVEEDMFMDPGDGNLINIKDTYNALQALPDDEAKQYLAFYISYYDAESVAAIVNAFSSEITSDPFELLNADNYEAFLEYFNDCLQA